MVWDEISATDFVLMDLTTNNAISLAQVKGLMEYVDNSDDRVLNTGNLYVEAASNLVSDHEYSLRTSSSAQGNEVRRLPDGTYDLNIRLGILDSYPDQDGTIIEYFSERSGQYFKSVTVTTPGSNTDSPPVTVTPVTPVTPETPAEVNPSSEGVIVKPSADNVKTETTADGKEQVTVALNTEDLSKAFEAAKSNPNESSKIVVNVEQKGASTKVELPVALLADHSSSNSDTVVTISQAPAALICQSKP